MPDDQEVYVQEESPPERYVVFLTYEACLSWGKVIEEGEALTVRLGYQIGKSPHGIYKAANKNRIISNGNVIGSYANMDDAYAHYNGAINLDPDSPLSETSLAALMKQRCEEAVVNIARSIRNGTYPQTASVDVREGVIEEIAEETPFLMRNVSDNLSVPNWLTLLCGGCIGAALGLYLNEATVNTPSAGLVHGLVSITLGAIVGAWATHVAIRKWGL